MTTTPTQEDTMAAPSNQAAAELTWQHVSLEHDPQAAHGLSADIVAYTADDEPIVSVIHIATRRHWNLTVSTSRWDPAGADNTPLPDLANVLHAWDGDEAVLNIVTETAMWQVLVEELPPART